MKLIIDVDKELVCKGFEQPLTEEERNILIRAIGNGIPYEEKPQGEFVKRLNEQIEKSVCKWCQMNKHCELCEISRVFMIIALTDKEMKGGAV